MAAIGSGINATLGRQDFSGITQGGQMMAQGILAGGQGIARGIEKVGDSAESAIKQYQTNKLMTGVQISKFEAAMQSDKDGSLQQALQGSPDATKLVLKMAKNGNLNLKEASQLGAFVDTFSLAKQREQAAMMDAQKLALDKQQNEINAYRANTERMGLQAKEPRGKVMTMEQLGQLKALGFDAKATPQDDGTFLVGEVSPFAPGAVTNVNMGEDSYAKEVGKQAAEQHSKEYAAAVAAPENLQKLDEVSTLLKTGDASTGVGAEILNNLNRVRSQFLGDKKAGKSVSDTQILDAMLGSDVFPQIQAMGIGARGLDTPNEREYLRQVMTGTISLDKDALIRLTDIRRNIQLRALEKFKKSYDSGTYKKFFEITGNPAPDFSLMSSGPLKIMSVKRIP